MYLFSLSLYIYIYIYIYVCGDLTTISPTIIPKTTTLNFKHPLTFYPSGNLFLQPGPRTGSVPSTWELRRSIMIVIVIVINSNTTTNHNCTTTTTTIIITIMMLIIIVIMITIICRSNRRLGAAAAGRLQRELAAQLRNILFAILLYSIL